ncbi:V/A-type H+-transporting ATPase subunit I [Clostridium punense]|uniref:V/A-type H+-transporting ATPase subunit I n=2 Tax=Clostridium TaxID=1485 RepID=A0ABS4K986_9CLOT|nr:V-type ATP synthase subunit I [Clostridium punense]EQB86530.1 hypothetical protein M918_13635 [Clostridium sp. BL8]MBP2023164.1 V/A-type H+-transporting ATPase subunit I [Clostridium punense]
MAIVKMNKFTLLAFESQKYSLLEKLQNFENVEFAYLLDDEETSFNELKRNSESIEISEIEGELSKIKFGIDLLSEYSTKVGMIKSLKEGKKDVSYETLSEMVSKSNWRDIYAQLKEKENLINKNKSEISKLLSNIEELLPWANLDTPLLGLNSLKSSISFLGVIPQVFMESVRNELHESFQGYYAEVISENTREANLLMIFHKEEEELANALLKKYSFSKASLNYEGVPKEIIKGYKEKIDELKQSNNTVTGEIKNYAIHLEEFKMVYEYYENKLIRLKSMEKFLKSDKIIAMEGHYPSKSHDKFMEVLHHTLGEDYYIEFSEAEGDDAPTLLENNSVFSAFEPITAMYSIPRYKEIDPTPLFAPFYILFFGMMLSDAGYGILMLLATGFALSRFNLDKDMRKTVKMFLYLSVSTIVWGVLYGSYFGGAIKIPPVWMTPESDVGLLMLVSIAMGLIQIFVGLGIKAYILIRDGKPLAAFLDAGLWYFTLTGSIIWAVSALGSGESLNLSPQIVRVAGIITVISMILIILTHGRGEKSIGAKLGTGFYSLYGITGYVGDLVSYTRLAALGLATGFIGSAFNIMVGMLGKSIFAIIFAVIIFTFGHIFNLLINALGSYVHTSRLQYLEYFGKFYEGGGKAFEPLKFTSKYYNISKNNK